MTRLTRIIAFAIALLITVTSQQMATARTMMMDTSGQVVLCTGQGPVTVTLDAQGNPMDVVHICPDCVLTLASSLEAPNIADPVVIHTQILVQTPARTLHIPVIPTVAKARAPPLFA